MTRATLRRIGEVLSSGGLALVYPRRPPAIVVPVQVLKRFLSTATIEENVAVTRLLRMVHDASGDGGEGSVSDDAG